MNVLKFFKYLLILNIIIIACFICVFIKNIVILKKLENKGSMYNYSNNFYVKYVKLNQEDYEVIERYYLPNKEMYVFTNVDKSLKEDVSKHIVHYDNGIRTELFENDKKEYIQIENSEPLEYDGFIFRKNLSFENTWHLIKSAAASRIKKVICNDRECYKISGKCVNLENNEGEVYWYIDAETGLFIREYGRNSILKKDVTKVIYNMFEEYTYEFENVKEEDFILPDLNEYKKLEY